MQRIPQAATNSLNFLRAPTYCPLGRDNCSISINIPPVKNVLKCVKMCVNVVNVNETSKLSIFFLFAYFQKQIEQI